MSRPSEAIILRQENAKLISEIRGMKESINRNLKINEELRLKVIKQDMVIREMNRKLAYYENPHSPPSGNNIPARKKKSEKRNIPKKDRQNPKPTRKVGSPGVSHHRKSSETITYKAARCKKCGSPGLIHKKVHQKQVTDIVFTVKTKTHCSYKSTCRCGCVTDSTPEWLKRNSSIGPHLTALGTLAWYNANSLRSIKKLLGFFGVKVCKRTVENMITSTAASMKKEVGKIDKEMENTKFGKMDETPIIVENHQGYVWVCVGDDAVSIHASHTRSAIVPE